MAQAQLPVPYSSLAAIEAQLFRPGSNPPGSNDWSCRPSAAHPRPVVLVHGLLGNMTDNWNTMSPLLKNAGYCVYAFTYGLAGGQSVFGGLLPMESSSVELSTFVDRVLAATGSPKVDLVGHSEGATMPHYYIKFLGGAAKVERFVGLAPVIGGTTLRGLAILVELFKLLPGVEDALNLLCGACNQMLLNSSFLKNLAQGGVGNAQVKYTQIVTRLDQVVTPFSGGLLPRGSNVKNLVLQDQCLLDFSEHLAIAFNRIAGQEMLNALDPANARPAPCTFIAPILGG